MRKRGEGLDAFWHVRMWGRKEVNWKCPPPLSLSLSTREPDKKLGVQTHARTMLHSYQG